MEGTPYPTLTPTPNQVSGEAFDFGGDAAEGGNGAEGGELVEGGGAVEATDAAEGGGAVEAMEAAVGGEGGAEGAEGVEGAGGAGERPELGEGDGDLGGPDEPPAARAPSPPPPPPPLPPADDSPAAPLDIFVPPPPPSTPLPPPPPPAPDGSPGVEISSRSSSRSSGRKHSVTDVMARRVDSPKTARGSSTQTAAAALQASDDVVFCGWTLKRGVFFWAPYYFAVTRHSELLWYEGGEAELKLAGKADLLLIKSITRDKPDSETNFSFRVVTPSATVC